MVGISAGRLGVEVLGAGFYGFVGGGKRENQVKSFEERIAESRGKEAKRVEIWV